MLARVEAGILAVLGADFDALRGRFRGDGTVDLCEVVVHRQRAGLTRLVFDGGNDLIGRIDELDRRQMGDARQGFELVSKCRLFAPQIRFASSSALPM